jgi:phytoene synthase
MMRDPTASSYAFCRQVVRRAGSSFTPWFLVLSPDRHRAMDALYAFMRHTDDLADNSEPVERRRQSLVRWRAALADALGDAASQEALGATAGLSTYGRVSPGGHAGPTENAHHPGVAAGANQSAAAVIAADPIGPGLLPALADAVRRFGIPAAHLEAVIDGVEMDLDRRHYQTFDQLADYCRHVASAVGLACIHVWGFRGQEAFGPASQCGLAFQLTNILRDLGEDAAAGRLYLPLDDLQACGYSPDDLREGVVDERYFRLMRLQTDRAEAFYRGGAGLFGLLEPEGRRIFGLLLDVYHRLLGRIRRRPADVLVRRVRLSCWQKLGVASRWMLLPPRRTALP